MLLADDLDDAWLTVVVMDNITAGERNTTSAGEQGVMAKPTKIQPNVELVQGTFQHYKDENFAEFLIAAGNSHMASITDSVSFRPMTWTKNVFDNFRVIIYI